jgi:hypothetical protein
MRELEQLLSIISKLESIGGNTAGALSDLSDWLYRDFPKMRGLVESAMQYQAEILEYNAEMDKPYKQLQLNAELNKAAGMGLTA